RAARAERRLRSATAERARQIRALSLLEEDDEDQEQADEDVDNDKNDSEHQFSEVEPVTTGSCEFFPEPAAMSTAPKSFINREKASGMKARAAHQIAVHITVRAEVGDVVGRHAAAVEHRRRRREWRRPESPQRAA